MKKQLLIAAVAASMSAASMADVSIAGNAKFEYRNIDTNNVSSNTTNTEVNLNVRGSNGDTKVIMDLEFNTHGGNATTALDVENLYLTTKIGMVNAKLGNYTTPTSAILGEIDNGSRATNKMTFSTMFNGVKVYAGNTGAVTGAGETAIDNNMFVGASATVQGWTLQAKKNSSTVNSFGVKGSVGPVGIRYEIKDNDAANSDVDFLNLTGDFDGVKVGYARLDADADSLITEDDSDLFAVENAGNGDSNAQFSLATTVAGNTFTGKIGSIGYAAATGDLDYTELSVSRALVSGSTLKVSYLDQDLDGTAHDTETLEFDLSVKF